jgi:hypothetical protein
MAIVPKNILTGANFGLTNLICVLYRAHQTGRLAKATTLIRHTDGGSDNVAYVTHVVHWLLVYLGIFDHVQWFRFEAGHSHTEIADRLFSLMKRTFITDDASRAQGVGSFSELDTKLHEVFKGLDETYEMNWNFANWDFQKWFNDMSGVLSPEFSNYTFDNVWNYDYVGSRLPEHGGVHVTYSERLSTKDSEMNPKYGPYKSVDVPGAPKFGGGAPDVVKKNITDPKGCIFMRRAPVLGNPVPCEAFNEKKECIPADSCRRIHTKWPFLTQRDKAEWAVLEELFREHKHAGAVRNMPLTKTVEGDSLTFNGSPAPLRDMLQAMQKFPRPLLFEDVWQYSGAPREFPSASVGPESSDARGRPPAATLEPSPAKDIRNVNVVRHDGDTRAQHRAAAKALSAEEWLENQPSRLESTEEGGLYIVQLEEADGQWMLGLVLAGPLVPAKEADGDEQPIGRAVTWFCRTSKEFMWAESTKFKLYLTEEMDCVPLDSFLLEVHDEDLTRTGFTNKQTNPQLTSNFVTRMKLFGEDAKLQCSKDTTATTATTATSLPRAQTKQAKASTGRSSGIQKKPSLKPAAVRTTREHKVRSKDAPAAQRKRQDTGHRGGQSDDAGSAPPNSADKAKEAKAPIKRQTRLGPRSLY